MDITLWLRGLTGRDGEAIEQAEIAADEIMRLRMMVAGLQDEIDRLRAITKRQESTISNLEAEIATLRVIVL